MSIKKDKSLLFDLSDLSMLELHAELAETVTWQGHPALKLNGLAVLPSMTQREGRVEAWIGEEGGHNIDTVSVSVEQALDFLSWDG